jgi:hypothetical protein
MNGKKNRTTRLALAVLLITTGVILILSNLGVISGSLWENLLRLWPALLVILGLSSMIQEREIFGPTITITLGTSLLLGNFGLITPLAWGILISLWPLLLVAGGLDVINYRRSVWAAIGSTSVLVALTFAIFWYGGAFTNIPGQIQPVDNLSVPLGEIEEADIKLVPGVGYVEITGNAEEGTLVSGSVPESAGKVIGDVRYTETSGIGIFRYTESDEGFSFPWTGGQQFYAFRLSEDVSLDLDNTLGFGFLLLDLAGLDVSSVRLSSGLGIAEIVLPETAEFTGEVDIGIGQTTIRIPENLPARVRVDRGLVFITIPEGWDQSEGSYTSPDFALGEPYLELTLKQAMGLLRIIEE